MHIHQKKKILIVGGVAGGASAAARLRRLDEQAEIILFERGPHISFANCGLPYYIGNTIADRNKLLVSTPEAMHQRFAIDVRVQSEVVSIQPEHKQVTVHSLTRGTYEESYDYLILSPGAKPIRPNISGIDHPAIFTLRNIPDADRIKEKIEREQIQRAIVVGGGYIGVEMAESLAERGLAVTIVEASTAILAPFDLDMSQLIAREMEHHGVRFILGDPVSTFTDSAGQVNVHLQSNHTLQAELIILAIGVTPDTAFLRNSGIALSERGHIQVNDSMQTNFPTIYAVGDAVEVREFVSGQKATIPLAGPANKQGRIAADHLQGIQSSYSGTQGTSILKVFDSTAACTGLNEKSLQRIQQAYHSVIVHPNDHANYYPGASPMTLKLLFDTEGKVLGAQAFGKEGVDKRIDVIATVIRLQGSIHDLAELELSYAPPYSSAKDPVNMAGFLAENVVTGRLRVCTVSDIDQRDREKSILLDVRTKKEYDQGHIPGATHIPIDEIRDRIHELPTNKRIYAYCEVGMRGYVSSRILMQYGFEVHNLTGGYKSYRNANWKPNSEVLSQI